MYKQTHLDNRILECQYRRAAEGFARKALFALSSPSALKQKHQSQKNLICIQRSYEWFVSLLSLLTLCATFGSRDNMCALLRACLCVCVHGVQAIVIAWMCACACLQYACVRVRLHGHMRKYAWCASDRACMHVCVGADTCACTCPRVYMFVCRCAHMRVSVRIFANLATGLACNVLVNECTDGHQLLTPILHYIQIDINSFRFLVMCVRVWLCIHGLMYVLACV